MFDMIRVVPLQITPYASNLSGLFAYANYNDLEVSTVEPIPTTKTTIRKPQLLPTPNATTSLKADTFSAHATNSQQAIVAKNSRVDAATESKASRFANVSLKQPSAQAKNVLNFMA